MAHATKQVFPQWAPATVCRRPKSTYGTHELPFCSESIKCPALPQGDMGEDVTVTHAELQIPNPEWPPTVHGGLSLGQWASLGGLL